MEKGMKEKSQLTTEILSSPAEDGDSFALTGGGVGGHGFTQRFLVPFKLTCIECAVVHVSGRVHVLVTISERPRLVGNDAAVIPAFVLVLLGFGARLARRAPADRRTARQSSHLPALP